MVFARRVIAAAAVLVLLLVVTGATASAAEAPGRSAHASIPVPTTARLALLATTLSAFHAAGAFSDEEVFESLAAKLRRAQGYLAEGHPARARASIFAFAAEARAQSHRHLTPSAGQALVAIASGAPAPNRLAVSPTALSTVMTVAGGNPVVVALPAGSGAGMVTVTPAATTTPLPAGNLLLAGLVISATSLSNTPVTAVSATITVTFTPQPGIDNGRAQISTIDPIRGSVQPLATAVTRNAGGTLSAQASSPHLSPFNVSGPSNVTAAFSPNPVAADGVSTSTLSIAVVDPYSGSPVPADPVTIAYAASPVPAQCGSLASFGLTTNAAGAAATTYTASAYPSSPTAGDCSFNVKEAAFGGAASVTASQKPAPRVITVGVSPASLPADNSSLASVDVLVESAPGHPLASEPVSLSTSSSCGRLGPSTGVTSSSGHLLAQYQASYFAGQCTITATDPTLSGGSGSAVVTQTQLPNSIQVAVSPGSLPPDGTSTATVSLTVQDRLGAVAGDPLAYSVSPASCGSVSGGGTTDAAGKAAATYTASSTAGICTITVTDPSGGRGYGTVTQQSPPNQITLTGADTVLLADGSQFVALTVTVTRGGVPVAGDQVTLGVVASITCGLVPSTLTTNATGTASFTYTSSTNLGACTLTADDASGGHAALRLLQTNLLTLTASSSAIVDDLLHGTMISVSASHLGVSLAGDTVTFSFSGPSCGSTAANSVTTAGGSSSVMTAFTAAPGKIGPCRVTATDSSGALATVIITSVYGLSVAASPGSVLAGGSTTSTVTATVTSDGVPIAGDAVTFTVLGSGCGSVTPSGITDATGRASATYSPGTAALFCTVAAAESSGNRASTVVTQAPVTARTLTFSASPSSIPANGAGTSTLSATVTNSAGAVAGDAITFTAAPSIPGACGTLSASSASTNAAGVATVTYTASSTAGLCTVTATDPGGSAAATVTQTAPAPNTVIVTSSTPAVFADGSSTAVISIHFSTPSGAPATAVAGTATLSGYPAPACGTLSSYSGTSNSSGNGSTMYTSSTTAGFCTITVTDATGGSGSVTIDQGLQASRGNLTRLTLSATSIAATGTSTSTATFEVRTAAGVVVIGDPVEFTLSPGAPGACGTLSAAFATTDSSGLAVVTYQSSTIAGPCTVQAQEALGASSQTAGITQT